MMKVQDLAKELGQHTKDFIKFLKEVDIKAKSGNTKLDNDTIKIVRDLFKEKDAPAPQTQDEQSNKNRYITLDVTSITVGDLISKLEVGTADMMRAILQKGLLLNLNSKLTKIPPLRLPLNSK